jgi:hypothetical protein
VPVEERRLPGITHIEADVVDTTNRKGVLHLRGTS